MKSPLEKFTMAIGGIVLVALTVLGMAILGGFILWLIYPHIHALFPSAAANGIIAKDLSLWDSICITWIFGILLKSTQTNNNKS